MVGALNAVMLRKFASVSALLRILCYLPTELTWELTLNYGNYSSLMGSERNNKASVGRTTK